MLLFGKKYREKLKKEILDEINIENKKELQEDKISKQQTQKNKEVKPVIINSKEDLEVIKQKMFIAMVIVVSVLVFMISFFILNGFELLHKKNVNVGNQVEEKDNMYKTINESSDGEISLNNIYIDRMLDEIIYNEIDYYFFDPQVLFKNEVLSIASLSQKDLLFIGSKTMKFKKIIDTYGLSNKAQICYQKGAITIDASEIKRIISNNYNINLENYDDFYYNYYDGNTLVANIKFTYDNGYYVSECVNTSEYKKPDIITETRAISAIKDDKTLEIIVKAVFVTNKGVYSDIGLTNMIYNSTDNYQITSSQKPDYFTLGKKWKYVYIKNTNNYYLKSIEPVND